MTGELATVLALLTAAIVMFALDRPRMDAVALLVMTLGVLLVPLLLPLWP
jgi:hypothetical protein